MTKFLRILPAVLALAAWCATSDVEAQERTICDRYDTGSKVTLLFIDRTSRDQRNVRAGLRRALDWLINERNGKLDTGRRLDIGVITDNLVAYRPLFSDCRPGYEPGVGNMFSKPLNRVTLAEEERRFQESVRGAVDSEMSRNGSTRQSAIIDTLFHIVRQMPKGSIDRVVLVSDMLDNVHVDLQKRDRKTGRIIPLPAFDRQETLRNLSRRGMVAQLSKVEITVFGFGFDDHLSAPLDADVRASIEEFWNQYFALGGAVFTPIY